MNTIISYSKNGKKAEIIYNCQTIHILNIHKFKLDTWIDKQKNFYKIKTNQIGRPEPIRVKMNEILS